VVSDSKPTGCYLPLGATPPGEKPVIYPDPYRKTSVGAVHESEIYSTRVSLKGLYLVKDPHHQKIKNKKQTFAS
jgi:hypothetical protein